MLDASRPRPRRDAVTDGVLDERLQEQMRDARVEDGGIDVDRDAEPIAEARLLDRQIRLQDLDLLFDADFLRVRPEAHSQQVAQSIDHDVGRLDVAPHQARDRVQRVEQEVRLELPLQRLELRLGEARLQPLGVERALLGLVPVRDGVAERRRAKKYVASIQSSCVRYCRCR